MLLTAFFTSKFELSLWGVMHKPVKYVEKGLTIAAKGAWVVFDALNSIKQNESFTPKWSEKPLLKSWQKVKPPLGWPRETDSLCPICVREARQEILDGKRDYKVLLTEKIGEIKATIIERDGKILMVKDCPIHGHFEDVMAIDTAFFKHLEESFPGSDIRAHNDEKLHNHGSSHDQVRPRLGAHDRPDEPLQHDVRPVLHGREPGRLRPRARLGRDQDAARQRHHDQAAAADVGAVLGRRADAVAVLPRRGALRAQGRLQHRAGGDQRHRVRQEPGVRQGGGRGGSALRLPAVRRHRQRGQLAPARRQPVRREAARHREPVARGRRHRAGHDDRQRREQRAGRPHHPVRARQPEEDHLPLVPAGVVHRPRRGDHRRAPAGAALHAVAPRARREEPDRPRRADARLVPDLVHGHVQRLGGPRARTGGRLGPALLRLPPELRRRHGRHDRQGNEGSRARHGVPARASSSRRTSRGSTTPRAAGSCRSSAWRWR